MEGGDVEAGFMANGDLDESATTRVRAPADEQPYGDDDDTSFCFASQFTPGDEEDPADLGAGELRDAYRQLHALVDRHLGNNTSMRDLVDAVHSFYESRIRCNYDYGAWSRKSIYRYVMHYSTNSEDRQSAEAIRIVWASIEMMREHIAVRDDATGKVTPDLRMMKSMQDAMKLHAALVDAKRKRPKNTT